MNAITDQPVRKSIACLNKRPPKPKPTKFTNCSFSNRQQAINEAALNKLPINYAALNKMMGLTKNVLSRIIGTGKYEGKSTSITYWNLQKIQECFIKNLLPHHIENLSEVFKRGPLYNMIPITPKMRAEIKTAIYEIVKSRPELIKTRLPKIDYHTLGKEIDFPENRLEDIIGHEMPSPGQFMTLFELKKIQGFFRDHLCFDDLNALHIFNFPDDRDDIEIEITPAMREEIKAGLDQIINVKRTQTKRMKVDLFCASQSIGNLRKEIRSYNEVTATHSNLKEVAEKVIRTEENLSEREHASYEQGAFFEEVSHLSKKAKTSSPYPLSTLTPVPEFKFFALEEVFQ